jgi:hypothetical protein
MSDIDTIARSHAAATRSWLEDLELPPRRMDTPVVSGVADRRTVHPPTVRWSPVWAFVAGFVAVIAVGVAMVALTINRGSTDPAGVALPPVDLGLGYVWSDQSGSSSPEALGAAFATQVLGWDHAIVVNKDNGDPAGPVGIQISQTGREPIDMATSPDPEAGRVSLQIGEPSTIRAVIPGELAGTRIGLVPYPGATSAEITVRTFTSDTEIVFTADSDDLEAGYVDTAEIPDAGQAGTVLVRYLDNNGGVVTATGGYTDSPTPLAVTIAPDGGQVSAPTTVPADQRERYFLRLVILDGVATVDGDGVNSEVSNLAEGAIDARCGTPAESPVDELLDETEPAYRTANRILNSLSCDVSTMAVTIDERGNATGVIGALDSQSAARIQQAVGDEIEVKIDHADQ